MSDEDRRPDTLETLMFIAFLVILLLGSLRVEWEARVDKTGEKRRP